MTAPVYFAGHVHTQDSRMSNNLQGLAHLAVPNHSVHPRPAIGSPSDNDHATSPIYSYQSGFSQNTRGGVSHTTNLRPSTGHGISGMNGVTEHASNMGSLSLRMYSDGQHGEPWNPMRAAYNDSAVDRDSFSDSHMKFGSYRQQQLSDIDSIVGPRSDSGYFTHPAPQSVISNEPEHADKDLPTSMFEISNLNVNSAPSESTTEYLPPPSDPGSVYSGRSQNKSIYQCARCKEVSKCPSDYKYVPVTVPSIIFAHSRSAGNICSNMTSHTHAISRAVDEQHKERGLLRSTTSSGTRRAFIASGSSETRTNARLNIAGIEARFGHVWTTSNNTSVACTETKTKRN